MSSVLHYFFKKLRLEYLLKKCNNKSMAKKKTKFDPFTRGVGKTAKARERDKQRKLKHVPDPRKTGNWNRRRKHAGNVGVTDVQQLNKVNGQGVPKGFKSYGWVEDHGHPDHVVVKSRMVADHPEGRREDRYCLDAAEEGRPDGGVRIQNKAKYNDNYDDIFGQRDRGVAAGHKKFKKKY
jgi:hypothetical protein